MEKFRVEYLAVVITDHLPNLSKSARQMIKKAIEERLMVDPLGFGKPLQYSWKGHRRLRVSKYRIIYKINLPKLLVTIVAIAHRDGVYDE